MDELLTVPKRRLRSSGLALMLIALLLSLKPALATNYTFSYNIDLSQATNSDGQLTFNFPSPSSYNLAVGDTLSGTFTFLNNQAISLSGSMANPNEETLFTIIPTTFGSTYSASTTATLLGVNGTLTEANPDSSLSSGAVLDAVIGENSNGPFSFTGFSYSFTYLSGSTTYPFEPSSFIASASSVSVVTAPEPSIWALLLSGFMTLAFFYRPRMHSRS